MSELDNVFTALRDDQRRRSDERNKKRRNMEALALAVDAGIGFYKSNMERKANDFLNTAQAVQGRNVYNQAQQLSKTYADHATKAQSYLGGEDAYIMDTFVTPYAQSIAQKDPYFNTKSDRDQIEIINSFSEKFGDEFKQNYRDIQASLKKLDLSKDYETFLQNEHVFSKNMGTDVMQKIFGGKSRADVILESEEGVIKQIAPEIYKLSTMQIYKQQGSVTEAKDFLAKKIKNAKTELEYKGLVTLPEIVIDGKVYAGTQVREFFNPVTKEILYFPRDGKGTNEEDQIFPVTTYKQQIKGQGDYGEERTFTTVIAKSGSKGNETEQVISTTDPTNADIYVNEATNLQAQGVRLYPDVPIAAEIKGYAPRERDVNNYIAENLNRTLYTVPGFISDTKVTLEDSLERIYKDTGSDLLTQEGFKNLFTDRVIRESLKIQNISTDKNARLSMATQIVLNRYDRLSKGEFQNFNGGSIANSTIANPLEVIEAYADLVEQGQINVDGKSLAPIIKMMNQLNVIGHTEALRNTSDEKKALVNALFSKESVKNLFNRELLDNRLVAESSSAEDLLFKKQILKYMEDTYGTLTGVGSSFEREVNERLNELGNNDDKNDNTGDPSPVGGRINVLKKDGQSHLEIVKAAAADDNLSKAEAAAITVRELINSGGRAIAQDIINIGQDSVLGIAFRNKQKIWDIANDPFQAIFESVFIPPNERQKRDSLLASPSGPIDEGKLADIYSGLDDDTIKEIIDEVNIRAQKEEAKYSLSPPDPNATVEENVEYVGNLLGDNNREIEFMKRVVNQESNFGIARGTNTIAGPKGKRGSFGVAQIDEVAFDQVQKKLKDRKNRLSKFVKPFLEATGLDLTKVTYEQLDDPILSIAFGRMYLRQQTSEPIPETLEDQAAYWKKYYNTSAGAGKPEDFIRTNQGRE